MVPHVAASGSKEFSFTTLKRLCNNIYQERTLPLSFDHFVGAQQYYRRHLEAERLGSFEVDYQVKLDWLLHWQIGWLGSLQYFVNEG